MAEQTGPRGQNVTLPAGPEGSRNAGGVVAQGRPMRPEPGTAGTTLRITRRWAESLLAWSDRADGFIGVVVDDDGAGQWYACDLQNALHLDGRDKAGHASVARAGDAGAYMVPRRSLAVALATTDAIARLEMHDADGVRVTVDPVNDERLADRLFGQLPGMLSALRRADAVQHGRGLPYHAVRRLAAHLADCVSSTGLDVQPVVVNGGPAWRIVTYSRMTAMVMGASTAPNLAQRRAVAPEEHPSAVARVMADTVQVEIPDPEGDGRTIHAYHLGDIDVGERVVVDTDGAPWVVGGES